MQFLLKRQLLKHLDPITFGALSSEEVIELSTLVAQVARAADGSFISGDHQTDQLLQLYFVRQIAMPLTSANRLVPLEQAKSLSKSNGRESSLGPLSKRQGSMLKLKQAYSVCQLQLENDDTATNPVQSASIRIKRLLERKLAGVNPLSEHEVEEYNSLVSHFNGVTTGDAMLDEKIAAASAAQAAASVSHLQVLCF
jgi:hypothetical protein